MDTRGKATCTAGNAPTHKVTAVKAAKIFPIFFNFIYSSHKFFHDTNVYISNMYASIFYYTAKKKKKETTF